MLIARLLIWREECQKKLWVSTGIRGFVQCDFMVFNTEVQRHLLIRVHECCVHVIVHACTQAHRETLTERWGDSSG